MSEAIEKIASLDAESGEILREHLATVEQDNLFCGRTLTELALLADTPTSEITTPPTE